MQVLGKKSKILLIVIAVVMMVAIGISFATWDLSAVKATSGNSNTYANAKVGDVITFGNYYQTGEKDPDDPTEYKKTPIEWIVVDKDERTGQLTLLSKYILACGSYFGNYYDAGDDKSYQFNYNTTKNADGSIASYSKAEVGGNSCNQAYIDSTVRAYLNNLERLDMGGDGFTSGIGYVPSKFDSSKDTTGLLSSVGFSNQRYWTGLKYTTAADKALVDAKNKGFNKRYDFDTEIYYQRPIGNDEFKNRPATKGFYDEAFTDEEKSMIVPKQIAGYTGHRWPDDMYDISTKSYVEGALDKVWLPSATELNVMEGQDWNSHSNDSWTNPSDEAGSTVFEYFKNLKGDELKNALIASRTDLATDGMAGNYSIPVYDKGTTTVKTAISNEENVNSSAHYWTRSPMSYWFSHARTVLDSGLFRAWSTHNSNIGVRPCVILKY